MLRFISSLLGRKYESCKGCEILGRQLKIANEEKKELLSTILSFVKPAIVDNSATSQLLEVPINQRTQIFARRRAMLEQRDRESMQIMRSSNLAAKPDNPDDVTTREAIEGLERELDLVGRENAG